MTTASLHRRLALLAASLVLATACSPSTPSPSAVPAASAAPVEMPTATPSPTPTEVPSPTAVLGYATLDGLPVDPSLAARLPVAVMVDDNAVARPQYGFNAASIVYQAPADGGEDRYMLVFGESDAPKVEPIRSGRPYFVNWASEYRAAFSHYGGDAKTLAYLPTINGSVIYNVDALAGAGSIYHRDSTRYAPHNAWGITTLIRDWAIAHDGAPATLPTDLPVRPFADDLAASLRPATGSITIPYSTGTTGYTYDAAADGYLRSVGGSPQLDAADGTRVTARNVVVLFMALSIDPESEAGHARPMLAQIGTGKALVFRDGHVIVGTWRKSTADDLTRFFDADGTEITLVRGRIFIQVVPLGANVTYDAAS